MLRIGSLFFLLFMMSLGHAYETSIGTMIRGLNQEIFKSTEYADQSSTSSTETTVTTSIVDTSHVEGATSEQEESEDPFKESGDRDYLFAVYIAGQNNLGKFVGVNLKSMAEVGSNQRVHVVAQVDELGKDEVTRVYVKKKKIDVLEEYEATEEYMSGTKESLFGFMEWAVKNFPTKKICLVIWNHGSGAIDPHMWDRAWFFDRDSDVFNFNSDTGLFELRSTVKDPADAAESERGVAFNEEQSVYLTNSDLTEVIECIQDELLQGEKLDILAFDACLMGMLEVACQISYSVQYMVASEEIVPGNGLPYSKILYALSQQPLSARAAATMMTQAYAHEYESTFAEFTLSALDLEHIYSLRQAMNDVATALITLIDGDYGEEFLDMLYAIRVNKKLTTAFYNRDYIDAYHTLESIRTRLNRFSKLEEIEEELLFLERSIIETLDLIKKIVVSNARGNNSGKASGIAMYWPRNTLHSSYQSTIFGKATRWRYLLQRYLSSVK